MSSQFFYDSVGRRRKLSQGAMLAIQMQFAQGRSVPDLARAFGVSTSLIRTVTYHTIRDSDRVHIKPSDREEHYNLGDERIDIVPGSPYWGAGQL